LLVPDLANYPKPNTPPPLTYHLVVKSGLKTTIVAGTPVNVVVDVIENHGHIATNFNGIVSVGLVSGPKKVRILGATRIRASNGVAVFRGLNITVAGAGYVAKVSTPRVPSILSPKFAVTPAATVGMIFLTQPPATVTAGESFTARVEGIDRYQNATPKFTGTVNLSLKSNPGEDTLRGKLSLKAAKGIATFSDLQLNKIAKGYALQATSPSLASKLSTPFAVQAVTGKQFRPSHIKG